jgi:predicted Zn-dependent protease
MTISLLASLWLFGSFFGDVNDCHIAEEQAVQTMREIGKHWPLRPVNDPVSAYVQHTGRRLVATIDPDSRQPWDFYVLRNSIPSALAVGGRHFVISDGLIALVRSEAELAAVLAHEISHEHLGHFCQVPSAAVEQINHGVVVQHYSLKIELEADKHATKILAAAGYKPDSLISVLSCLRRISNRDRSHLTNRIKALQRLSLPRQNTSARHSTAFASARRRVLDDLGGSLPRSCR